MKAVNYALNFLIIFCLVSAIWIKTLGISIESKERIWGRAWMHLSDNPAALILCALLLLILRLIIGQTEKKRK